MDTSSQLYSTCTSNNTMGEAMTSSTTPSVVGGGGSSSSRRSRDMENLSLEISKYPRDLLQRFLGSNTLIRSRDDVGGGAEGDDVGGVNLGLGLSLGGKFGVDKSHKGLVRSSSIIGTMPLIKDEETIAPPPPPLGSQSLARTSSLPVESEEEWRKRKEIQSLRRMEAKRRRSEKQRILKESGGGGGGEDKGVESLNVRGRLEKEQQCLGISGNKPVGNPFGSSSTPPIGVRKRTTFGSLHGFLAQAQAQAQSQAQAQAQSQAQQGCSQGSRESHGGSSSGASELESKTQQGSSSCGEARSPASIHSIQGSGTHEPGTKGDNTTPPGPTREAEMASSKQTDTTTENRRREATSSSGMEDMPCVFTIGERKVEGILYRYGKGEEVRIMCVCHGHFYSPAEFVKHAGGRDVEHPLRHIVVSPTTSTFQ